MCIVYLKAVLKNASVAVCTEPSDLILTSLLQYSVNGDKQRYIYVETTKCENYFDQLNNRLKISRHLTLYKVKKNKSKV